MAVQWYPGHMNKARKEIVEALPTIDLIIEIIDARIPFSSENPMLGELRGNKPCIKVLNKSDLADPEMTECWQKHLEQEKGVKTLAFSTTEQPARAQQIISLCHKLFPAKVKADKPIHAMIMGIPNVGKSTLINTLAGRAVAHTGNEPAVTKHQQRIKLEGNITLFDTPGMLWPKVENENSSYRLAVTGAIKDTAMEYDDVAFFAAEYFLQHCPEKLAERYEYDETPVSELAFLEAIGRRRGCLGGGGLVDLHKASVILLNDYRSGALGAITLESPQMADKEKREAAQLMAEKEAKKQARREQAQTSKKRKKRR